ncbi:hypothetical protein TRIUR3_29841 [Triticum urartu]|uniref:Uncharacterized protein n=1 Tax=Triticum urartu TaxID=4572 RepID=M7YN31_TRIUA|nr:hypothetical protein TRIUR3_29841 [Triticum urartu]
MEIWDAMDLGGGSSRILSAEEDPHPSPPMQILLTPSSPPPTSAAALTPPSSPSSSTNLATVQGLGCCRVLFLRVVAAGGGSHDSIQSSPLIPPAGGQRALCFVVPHPSSRSWMPLLHRPPPSLPARSDAPAHLLPAEDDEGEDAEVGEGGGGGGMCPVAIRWPCVTCALKNKRGDME